MNFASDNTAGIAAPILEAIGKANTGYAWGYGNDDWTKRVEKKLADIAFTLNIEDLHIVNYSLKKLSAAGLVKTDRRGKEVLYSTNDAGQTLCKKYFALRERVLVSNLTGTGTEKFELSELARFLRMLSGLYDQAARAATSL